MMDVQQIREYIPHRYPFLLIDRVIELELKNYIVGYKNVTINEPFFDGHFPDKPVMPGVLIIEALAQAAGVLGYKTLDKRPSDGSMYLFAGADRVRFRRQVVPGDQLMLRVDYVSDRRGIWKFECRAEVDDNIAATATILCADRPR